MRTSMLVAFGLCGLISSGWLISARAQDDAEAELKKLSGDYVLVSGEADGEELPEKLVKDSTLTLKGAKYTVKLGDHKASGIQKVDPTKKPKEIDGMDMDGPSKDMTIRGIYKLEKDVLTVRFALSGKDRPRAFTGKTGKGEFIHVWKKK